MNDKSRKAFENEYLKGIDYLSYDDRVDRYIIDVPGRCTGTPHDLWSTVEKINVRLHVYNSRQKEITALQEKNKLLQREIERMEYNADQSKLLASKLGHSLMLVINSPFVNRRKIRKLYKKNGFDIASTVELYFDQKGNPHERRTNNPVEKTTRD